MHRSTSIAVSSRTSRATASSRLSPGSTKPASVEYMPGRKFLLRPSSARSPSVTSMITAGSVRGKCIVAQPAAVQRRTWPASSLRVGAPQTPQKRWRECQKTIARANASNAPSCRARRAPNWRRSPNRSPEPAIPAAASAGERSISSGASCADRSSAKWARSSIRPRKMTCPCACRSSISPSPEPSSVATISAPRITACGFAALDLEDEALRAPDRHEKALAIQHPGANPFASRGGAARPARNQDAHRNSGLASAKTDMRPAAPQPHQCLCDAQSCLEREIGCD